MKKHEQESTPTTPAKQLSKQKYKQPKKDFKDKSLGQAVKIKSKSDYKAHVMKVMNDPSTRAYRTSWKRDIYYHAKSNTLVVRNPHDKKNGGTCFRPKEKAKYGIREQIRKDQKNRLKQGLPKGRIVRGGYPALMKQQQRETAQSQQKAKAQTQPQQPTLTAKPKPKSAKLTRLTQGRSAAKARIKSETRSENRSAAPKPQKSKAARIAGGKRSKAAPAAKRTKAAAPSKAKPAAVKGKSKAARIGGGRSPSLSRSEGRSAKPSRARTQTRSKD